MQRNTNPTNPFVQSTSFVKLKNGNMKRLKTKFLYKDIYLEQKNYVYSIADNPNKNQPNLLLNNHKEYSSQNQQQNNIRQIMIMNNNNKQKTSKLDFIINDNNHFGIKYHSPQLSPTKNIDDIKYNSKSNYCDRLNTLQHKNESIKESKRIKKKIDLLLNAELGKINEKGLIASQSNPLIRNKIEKDYQSNNYNTFSTRMNSTKNIKLNRPKISTQRGTLSSERKAVFVDSEQHLNKVSNGITNNTLYSKESNVHINNDNFRDRQYILHYAGQNSHRDNTSETNRHDIYHLQENTINNYTLIPNDTNKENVTNLHFNTESINTNTLHSIPITQLLTTQQKTLENNPKYNDDKYNYPFTDQINQVTHVAPTENTKATSNIIINNNKTHDINSNTAYVNQIYIKQNPTNETQIKTFLSASSNLRNSISPKQRNTLISANKTTNQDNNTTQSKLTSDKHSSTFNESNLKQNNINFFSKNISSPNIHQSLQNTPSKKQINFSSINVDEHNRLNKLIKDKAIKELLHFQEEEKAAMLKKFPQKDNIPKYKSKFNPLPEEVNIDNKIEFESPTDIFMKKIKLQNNNNNTKHPNTNTNNIFIIKSQPEPKDSFYKI